MIYSLTHDDALVLRISDACADVIREWLPLHARIVAHDCTARATMWIDVAEAGGLRLGPTPAASDLPPLVAVIGRASLYIAGSDAWIICRPADGTTNARAYIDLAQGRAAVELDLSSDVDIHSVMNFAVSMLLARSRRYLMHCGAVQMDDEGVWLLAGDSGAGKTTTTLNLAHAGCGILADDHILLYRDDDAWCIEGWPRPMHVDTGWSHTQGVPTGVRMPVDPRTVMGNATTVGTGRLCGLLLPCVARDAVHTTMTPATHADALVMLLRQTAWSIADPAVAAVAFADITDAAAQPAFVINLAVDTFADPPKLRSIVRETIASMK